MEGVFKSRGVKEIYKSWKNNEINKIQKLCVINAILNQYKIKYFKGTNFRGIDFLVWPSEIFVQILIFMYFTPKVAVTGNIFNKGYPVCEVTFIRRGV